MDLTFNNLFYQLDDESVCNNKKVLESIISGADEQYAEQHSEEENMEMMDKLDAAMRIRCVHEEMKELAEYMRKQEKLITYGQKAGYNRLEFYYFQMQFFRYNGLLYRQYNQPAKAVECYETAAKLVRECFEKLCADISRTDSEKEFIGWSLHEVLNEASACADAALQQEKAFELLKEDVQMLQWVEVYLNDGLLVEAAELYGGIGGGLMDKGMVQDGNKMYQMSIQLFQQIADRTESPFIKARGLWMVSRNVMSALQYGGGAEQAAACEKEVAQMLGDTGIDERDRMIALGTGAALKMCRMNWLCAAEQSQQAVRFGTESLQDGEKAIEVLERIRQSARDLSAEYFWLSKVCAQLQLLLITITWSLGLTYFQLEDMKMSEESFQKCLTYVNDNTYSNSAIALACFRVDSYMYLSLLATFKNDVTQMEFYGSKCIEDANVMLATVVHPMLLGTKIKCAVVLSENYLNLRDKKNAEKYSSEGLDACRMAREKGILTDVVESFEQSLEKYHKKATRRFF